MGASARRRSPGADPVSLVARLRGREGALFTHWRHPVPDYPQTGDAVQQAVVDAARQHLVPTVRHVELDLDLAVHVRPHPGEDPARVSVAGRDGLC